MIRPHVTNFLDKMLRDTDESLRFEECTIPSTSPLVDKVLAQCGLRTEQNLLIVAARLRDADKLIYSPGGDFMLKAGMTLILLGETEAVQRLRKSDLFGSCD
jgi:voltage-gated potassium channel